MPNTRLDAWPDADYVDAWDWVAGEPLTITIDNPDIPGIEYTETQIPEYPDWDPNQTYAQFYFAGSFDLQPGFIVTLENELKTKQHIVTSLAITGFDLTADLVWGIANPEVDIWIWVCDDTGCATRHAFTDGLGNWIVNFAETGAEPYEDVIWDLVPGSSGSAAEPDATMMQPWWIGGCLSKRKKSGDLLEPIRASHFLFSDWLVIFYARQYPRRTGRTSSAVTKAVSSTSRMS